ncbi:tetratricopeptide repeat protein [Solihabitans fulvus]|uniref:Tetratricopeptide repeat protein n=1 Tax=Solihabitans fulvus TaxID=1892852 RepID=A0A5B2XHG8_9PSEU|nr:BTAD domain-containing putative transcriptional regulator [Solihabitans fulvus]KAA2262843.1 tetratricopeptide repeat protein [Solihabitans fulvus]
MTAAMGLTFRLLGPLEVRDGDTPVRITGTRGQTALAALLLEANRLLPVERLAWLLWGEEPPVNAVSAVHSLIYRLRGQLAETTQANRDLIERSGPGYLLRIDPDQLDTVVFERSTVAARATLRAGDARAAHAGLTEALALWRGPALADIIDRLAHQHRMRLDELRTDAVEELIEAKLALGLHTEAISELRPLLADHPTRERLRAQLMLAQYRSGQPAAALESYEQARRRLADELGADPGPELQQLHQQILRNDPALALAAGPAPARREAAAEVRRDLPRDLGDFTGRETELQHLLEALPTDLDDVNTTVVIEAIDGMAGIGKTALAVHVAHRLADRYPDAQLFIDLHAHTIGQQALEPDAALDALLRALGVDADRIPKSTADRAALWRAELARRRAVIVLDNAASAAQVLPLLPGSGTSLTLITSRRRLVGIDDSYALSIDVLPASDAASLFAQVVNDARSAAEPEAVQDVVRLCGYLPLAVRIAAARLRHRPTWTVGYLAGRLHDEQRRFAELHTGDRGVGAALALSYQQLTERQRHQFQLLALLPGADIDTTAAAAIIGAGRAEAEELLEELLDMHLLQQRALDRYRFHDLVRAYTRQAAHDNEPTDERRAAVDRLLDYYLHTAAVAADTIQPGQHHTPLAIGTPPSAVPPIGDYADAVGWLETERANLVTAIGYAAEHGSPVHAWQLADVLWRFLYIRGHVNDWMNTHQIGLAAARALGDPHGEARMLSNLAVAHWHAGRYEEALEHNEAALPLYRKAGNLVGEARTRNNLGIVFEPLGRHNEMRESYEASLAIYQQLRDRRGQALTLGNLGIAWWKLGSNDRAREYYLRGLEMWQELGDRRGQAAVRSGLGSLAQDEGRYDEALAQHSQSLALMREVGDRRGEASSINFIAVIRRHLGELAEALASHQQALDLYREIGDQGGETEVLNDLGRTHRVAGDLAEASSRHRAALELARRAHFRHEEGRALDGIAHVEQDTGRPAAAREHWEQALTIFTELNTSEAEVVRELLAGRAHVSGC